MAKAHSTSIQLPLPLENATIELPLDKGQITIIDAIDADLCQFPWFALRTRTGFFYAKRFPRFGEVALHRVIVSRVLNRTLTRDEEVDHIDGDRLNNRRSNLRVATRAQNLRNRGAPSHNKSGYKGVSWYKKTNQWRARIAVDGKSLSLGLFDMAEDAYEAYCKAAKELHGEFAHF